MSIALLELITYKIMISVMHNQIIGYDQSQVLNYGCRFHEYVKKNGNARIK